MTQPDLDFKSFFGNNTIKPKPAYKIQPTSKASLESMLQQLIMTQQFPDVYSFERAYKLEAAQKELTTITKLHRDRIAKEKADILAKEIVHPPAASLQEDAFEACQNMVKARPKYLVGNSALGDTIAGDFDKISNEFKYMMQPTNKFDELVSAKTVISNKTIDPNPKKAYGNKLVPLNYWSPLASAYGALGLYNGSLKYGIGNYKAVPVEASIYIAAAMRHLSAWAEGEEFDPKDGVPNLGGVLANIAILLDARSIGNLIDDRHISGGYLKEREALSEIASKLSTMYPDKNPKHYLKNG